MVLLRVRLNVGMHRKCDGIFAINYLPYVPLWQKKKIRPLALKGGIPEKDMAFWASREP